MRVLYASISYWMISCSLLSEDCGNDSFDCNFIFVDGSYVLLLIHLNIRFGPYVHTYECTYGLKRPNTSINNKCCWCSNFNQFIMNATRTPYYLLYDYTVFKDVCLSVYRTHGSGQPPLEAQIKDRAPEQGWLHTADASCKVLPHMYISTCTLCWRP